MAGIPKVKITFDADFGDLQKGLKNTEKDMGDFATQATAFGKKAALAFAVVGAAALAMGADFVKAAAEDEASQKKLEDTIRATTTATEQQIAMTSGWITKQSIASATTDDVLRPALSRLIRSTNDVEAAQRLLIISQDIAAATGKPLEAVTNAIGKAYDGSTTALGKLGIGIDSATLKSGDFNKIIGTLETTFGGFQSEQSTTAKFKFEQIKIAADEAKEAIGAALLPIVKKLADYILLTVVPNLNLFIAGLTGNNGLQKSLINTNSTAYTWGERIKGLIKTVINFKDEIIVAAKVLAAVFVTSTIVSWVTASVAAIRTLIVAYNALKASAFVAGVAAAFALNPALGIAAGAAGLATLGLLANQVSKQDDKLPTATALDNIKDIPKIPDLSEFAGAQFDAAGNSKSTVGNTLGEQAKKLSLENTFRVIEMNNTLDRFNEVLRTQATNLAAAQFAQGQTREQVAQNLINNVFNVQGAIDPEGVARQIVDILNQAQARGTLGAGALVA